MPEKSFNLCTQPWIKIISQGQMSLKAVFSAEQPLELGGSPLERLLVMRLLLAITQRACPLSDDEEWMELSIPEMATAVCEYLNSHINEFDLYDEQRPFLQVPGIVSQKKKVLSIAGLPLGIANGNTTVLTSGSVPVKLSDAEKTYVLLQQVMFAFGGKKADQSIVLGKGVEKSKSAPPAPAVGPTGYLHNYVLGRDLLHTVYLNLITEDDIDRETPYLTDGMGIPPWEQMPVAENDEIAERIKKTYIGRLVPLVRFCRIDGDLLHITQGVQLPGLSEGCGDWSIAYSQEIKANKSSWRGLPARRNKLPWRQMDAILSFGRDSTWDCKQLKVCLNRKSSQGERIGVWSVGVQLSAQAGEQYLSGKDGYIDSEFRISPDIESSAFFSIYKKELEGLEKLAKIVYSSTKKYYQELGSTPDESDKFAKLSQEYFWKKANLYAQSLEAASEKGDAESICSIRMLFARSAKDAFNKCCPKFSSRQILAWAKNEVNVVNYLNPDRQKEGKKNGK